MGDAAGELSEDFHFLSEAKLLLEQFEAGEVVSDGDAADGDAGAVAEGGHGEADVDRAA